MLHRLTPRRVAAALVVVLAASTGGIAWAATSTDPTPHYPVSAGNLLEVGAPAEAAAAANQQHAADLIAQGIAQRAEAAKEAEALHQAQLAAAIKAAAKKASTSSTASQPAPQATGGSSAGGCSIPSACPAMRQCENGGSYAAGKSFPTYFGAYQFNSTTWATASSHALGGAYGSASAAQQDAAADWLYANADPAHQWPVCHKYLARYAR